LCGAIDGGALGPTDFADASKSAWFNACSAGGTQSYPYGNVYDPLACNGNDYGLHEALPVGSLSGCVGGYPGIFDLSGNVREWVDACNLSGGGDASLDSCLTAGGNYNANNVACSFSFASKRYEAYWDIGFRCCVE